MAIPLRADVKLPLLPESDEVEWNKEADAEGKESDDADDSEDSQENDDEDDDEKGDEDDDPAVDDGVSGEWTGRVLDDGIPEELKNFTIVVMLGADGSASGRLETHQGTVDLDSGSFDKESGALTLSGGNSQMSVTIAGTVKAGKFSGTATVNGGEMVLNIEADRSASASADSDDDDGESSEKDGKKKDKKKPDVPVEIEFDGIQRRMFQLPVKHGNFGKLAVNDKNHLIYARNSGRGGEGAPSINIFDIKDEKKAEKKVVEGAGNFGISADHKKLAVMQGRNMFLVDAAAGQKLDQKFQTQGMKTTIDPRQEWKQVFTDAWRVERDFFYDPTMHGVDWQAIHDRYYPMIDDCTSRADLGFVIGEMISEINVGHAYYRAGPGEGGGASENVGLLGCSFAAEDNRYRIDDIYEGADWDTDARNPLRQVGITEGDFILEVNGLELTADRNPYAAFVGMAGMTVTLTISKDAKLDDDDKRIAIELLNDDDNLRFRDWIEKNRKFVEERSDGKVGYIYVVNTGVPGQNDLFRQFYGQASKEALIIDDRWNGGGQIPTRFIELLNRPVTNYWAKRDGRDWTWPPDSHQGPKCMLINGMAGSGGDMFPALFRQNELGKLVGMRTWGGLVGISGNPQMIDGSGVTAPTFAYYEKDGTWGIEGHGVDPDIEVVDDPAKMVDGGDPQLEAAVELMLAEIKANGYQAPERPAYPNRVKIGIAEEDK